MREELSRAAWDRLLGPDDRQRCDLEARHPGVAYSCVRQAMVLRAAGKVGQDSAEDVVQRALCVAWKARSGLRLADGGDRDATAFVKFVNFHLTNAIRDHVRRAYHRHERPLTAREALDLAAHDEIPFLGSSLFQDVRERLYAVMDRVVLSHVQAAFVNQWLDGQTQSEIAAYFGVHQSTVCRHIAEAAPILAAALDGTPGVRGLRRVIIEEQTARERCIYHAPPDPWDRSDSPEREKNRLREWDSARQKWSPVQYDVYKRFAASEVLRDLPIGHPPTVEGTPYAPVALGKDGVRDRRE